MIEEIEWWEISNDSATYWKSDTIKTPQGDFSAQIHSMNDDSFFCIAKEEELGLERVQIAKIVYDEYITEETCQLLDLDPPIRYFGSITEAQEFANTFLMCLWENKAAPVNMRVIPL